MIEQNTDSKLTETTINESSSHIKAAVLMMKENGVGHELFYNDEAIEEE